MSDRGYPTYVMLWVSIGNCCGFAWALRERKPDAEQVIEKKEKGGEKGVVWSKDCVLVGREKEGR